MDCGYVLYNIPATARSTKKWVVIYAGGCYTCIEGLGDFFGPNMGLNIFGLCPCGRLTIIYVLLVMAMILHYSPHFLVYACAAPDRYPVSLIVLSWLPWD